MVVKKLKSKQMKVKIGNQLLLNFIFIFNVGFLFSCASTPVVGSGTALKLISEDQYDEIIRRWTGHEHVYSGLYNLFEVYVTLKGVEVLSAQLDQNARNYQWDEKKMTDKKMIMLREMENETEVFLSLYTPERRLGEMGKNKTMWRVFLDANGHRYEGTPTKVTVLPAEIQGLYPHHNRFFTPYSVKFRVAATQLVGKKVRFTMTGPIGSVSTDFPTQEVSSPAAASPSSGVTSQE